MRVLYPMVAAALLLRLAPATARAGDNPAAAEGTIKRAPLEYPYVATKQRAAQIRENYAKVRPGMTPTQVVTILGEPEEIRSLHESKIRDAKRIGTTYWFIIERRKPSGSVNEMAEKLVRVSFDLNQVVTRVDHWGF